tara:strand:- start:1306 stop:1563 length:258 start_codon:yes stop_codon:yes gene_type:complete
MKLKNILTFLLSLFIFLGCSSTEKTEFLEERKKKLDSLNEECDFATIEYSFPEDIYICYKTPSRIKDNKPEEETEEIEKSDEDTE